MEEPRWFNSADEYRAVQSLVRAGRYQEALERAERALMLVRMGRKHTARLHSLACWLYTDALHRTCPAAALHGEEAVRIARLVRDVWIKCEALARLIHAYCHMEQTSMAEAALEQIHAEFDANPGVLTGGYPALCLLESTVALSRGEARRALAALEQGERHARKDGALLTRLRAHRAFILLSEGDAQAARTIIREGLPETRVAASARLEWLTAAAWLAASTTAPDMVRPRLEALFTEAAAEGHLPTIVRCRALQAMVAHREREEKEARRLAHLAYSRALAAGRMDLARQLRHHLADLL